MRARPCLPPTHYRHWPIMLRGPHTHTHTGCIIAEKLTHLFTPRFTLSPGTTQSSNAESTHWGKKQPVNNWQCRSATVSVGSEGTACKHHRRKVKAPTSNYLSPKAIAVEAKCYWREPTWWTSLEETLMRCNRQIQYYLSDCIFWWSRSWHTWDWCKDTEQAMGNLSCWSSLQRICPFGQLS